jgi:ribosomal protein S18 acetylase RimI-like enzyme
MGADAVQPRRAVLADVPAVEVLVAAAYCHYVERIGVPPMPMVDDYPARVAAGQAWVVDGTDGAGLVGLLVVEEHPDHLYVDNVAVAPARQGTGVGGGLLAFAHERAVAAGLPELRLVTNELMTENRALYARLGWTETGRVTIRGRHAVEFAKAVTAPR